MNIVENITEKVKLLPDDLQKEVLAFVESLLKQYLESETAANQEFEILLLQLLKERKAYAEKNPQTILSSEENRKIILEKFKWNEKI